MQNGSFACLTQLGREGTKQQQFTNKVINLNISSQKASIVFQASSKHMLDLFFI